MRYAPGLWHIILVFALLVTLTQDAQWLWRIWDERLLPPRRVRPGCNPKRNGERRARRRARWRRRQPPISRAERGRRRARMLRQLLNNPLSLFSALFQSNRKQSCANSQSSTAHLARAGPRFGAQRGHARSFWLSSWLRPWYWTRFTHLGGSGLRYACPSSTGKVKGVSSPAMSSG
jgi:hypothetical protein